MMERSPRAPVLRSIAFLAMAPSASSATVRSTPSIARAGATSLHQIAEALNARGITTPRGGRWHAKSVSNVLARPQGRSRRRPETGRSVAPATHSLITPP
jgi:Recombinase